MSLTPSDLLADLPDPRDDEPSSLRSDIAEELTDHLVCSVRREMVKGADEPTAWERALKRFGDPRQIARKLWWLAMRRRIMNQRLMLGLQGVMLIAVIAFAAVMIQMSNAQQRQMAQQQEVLTTALAKLSEPRESPQVTLAAATLQVEVRGTPVSPGLPRPQGVLHNGWAIHVEGLHIANEHIKTDKVCDLKSPRIDFGEIPTGAYELRVSVGEMSAVRRITIGRGQQALEVFNAPPRPMDRVSFPLQVEIPADFQPTMKEHHLAIAFEFLPQPVVFEQQEWTLDGRYEFAWTPESIWFPSASAGGFDLFDSFTGGFGGLGAMIPVASPGGNRDGQLTMRNGAHYRLNRVRVLSGQLDLHTGGSLSRPVGFVRDSSASTWPAELKKVFTVETDHLWRIAVPPALINDARAQLAELTTYPPLPGQPAAGVPASTTPDPKHNRVQVRVVEGKADGPVIKTAKVSLTQPAWAKPLSPAVDKDGQLDFGYLDAGLYTLTTALDWGPTGERRFVVHPGKNVVETVVAPVSPERGLEVRIVAPLPAKLREAGVVLQLDPQPAGFAAPFEAWKWETEGFNDTIRGTSGGGKLPPIRLTEQAGDSLVGTVALPPGTYICPTASLRDRSLKRVLAQGKLLNHDNSGIARPNEGIITLTKPDQEWRIDLPTDLVGGALDSLTAAEPASK